MEKLGVVIDQEKSKTASEGNKCPKCGGPVYGMYPASRCVPKSTSLDAQYDREKSVPWCQNCGTEPFEAK